MSKPKVLVCLLTGTERSDWINPELVYTLIAMSHDPRFHVEITAVKGARPFDMARNQTVKFAREKKVDWLVSLDNDNWTKGFTPLDIIAAAGPRQHVIGLRYGTAQDGGYGMFPSSNPNPVTDGPFEEVQSVAGGVLMVNRAVWEKISRGPWFKWQHGKNETLDNSNGGGYGEDLAFCHLVRSHGFKVWTHSQAPAGHYKTIDATGMVHTLALLAQGSAGEQPKQGGLRRAAERVAGAFGFGE
jgi:hypothetical protein